VLRNAFLKSFLFNRLKSTSSNKPKSGAEYKRNEAFHLNKIKLKNIDDPNTDEDNYDDFEEDDNEDDDDDDDDDDTTVATTVTTYTNLAAQSNPSQDDEDYLLIGSWLYEQINSGTTVQEAEAAAAATVKEAAKASINETNLSNSTQILDTTFDLDVGNAPDQGVRPLFIASLL
jgi:hypothetical protein